MENEFEEIGTRRENLCQQNRKIKISKWLIILAGGGGAAPETCLEQIDVDGQELYDRCRAASTV